ncbi:MAG: DUF4860 domain-containing protein [Lachnospiraceae bacterium]|nr:DUF4860 domain-containing protein [Lachnospiraceae bacterium]
MIKSNAKRHSIDVFFVLCIFLAFALSISALLVVGAKTYQSISQNTEDNYQLRTSLLYVSNKVKAFNENGMVYKGEFNGGDALFLQENIDGISYVTKIYAYEGQLYELFSEADNDLDAVSGTKITAVSAFEVTEIEKKLLKIKIKSPQGKDNFILTKVY